MSEASRYRKTFTAEDMPESRGATLIADLIRPGELVLDIGCGSGELSEVLTARGAIVDGIEADEERAAVASTRLRHVETGIVTGDFQPSAAIEDTILFVDVIEHIWDLQPALQWAADRLLPGGRIIAKIPNSANAKVRWKMLRGDWSYQDSGYFDRDHCRFYDLKTMSDIPALAGLVETNRWLVGTVPGGASVRRIALESFPALMASAAVLEWRKAASPG
jgi:SAM-dependent methyltransferase